MKITLMSELRGVVMKLISANYRKFQTYIWHTRCWEIFEDILLKEKADVFATKYGIYPNSLLEQEVTHDHFLSRF